jgi:hypothetical protein
MTSQVKQPDASQLSTSHERESYPAPPGLLDSGMLFVRTAQLACEGVVSLLLRTSPRDVWDQLIRAGLDWEDDYTQAFEHRKQHRSRRA